MRINTSQMTVDTQYASLDEMVEIIGDRSLSQFYYRGTTDVWKPNRATAPLTLSVRMTVVDPDTKKQYTPTITNVKWYINGADTDTSSVPETSVPMIVATGSDWYMVNNSTDNSSHYYVALANLNLKVRKNVPPSTASGVGAVTILAYITYTDPRTGGALYTMGTVLLSTDLDADGKYDVHIQAPKVVEFDPFREVPASPVEPNYAEVYSVSQPLQARMSIKAKAYYGDAVLTSGIYFEWYALDKTEGEKRIDLVDIPNNVYFPCYISGQGTDTLTINPMSANNLTIICRIRETTGSVLKPCRDTISFAWKIPDISAEPYSPQGAGIRDSSPSKKFDIIYNAQGYGTLSNAIADANFVVRWYKRAPNGSYSHVTDGREMEMSAGELKNNDQKSNNIMAETYLLSEYKPVTVSDNGPLIFLDDTYTTVVVGRET